MRTGTFCAPALVVAALLVGGCSNTRSIQYVRDCGDRAYQIGDYDTAEKEYAEVVDRAPTDWQYRVALGKTLLVQNKPRAAREQLAVAFNIRPDDQEIVDLLAKAMVESGDKDGMFRLLKQRAEERRTVEDYTRLGNYSLKAGDVDQAERAYLVAARYDKGVHVGPQLELAQFYMKIKDDKKALERLRMALYIDPKDEKVQEMIRALGEVPGPTYALKPSEAE